MKGFMILNLFLLYVKDNMIVLIELFFLIENILGDLIVLVINIFILLYCWGSLYKYDVDL